MKKRLIILIVVLFTASTVNGHSGGTDRCGGHNDRKHGGYHIHNYSKYCTCYPEASICQKNKDSQEEKTEEKEK